MGLAATQARFLAITSRKANCEFRSMQLAQQKLSLSRELEEATLNYNDAINATKMIWDADGTGAFRYDLSYDLMMTPSDLNQYIPYLLSRRDGKIALDDKMTAAVQGIINSDGGIIRADGTVCHLGDSDYEDEKQRAYNDFIESMRENRAIPSSILNKLYDPASGNYQYISDAGVGGEMSRREEANMMTMGSMLSYVDDIVSLTKSGYYAPGSDEAKLAESFIFDFMGQDYLDSADEARDYGDGSHGKGDPVPYGISDGNLSCYLFSDNHKINGATRLFMNDFTDYDNGNGMDFDEDDTLKGRSPLRESSRAFTLSDLLNNNFILQVNGKDSDDIRFYTVLDNIAGALETGLGQTEGGISHAFENIINGKAYEWYDEFAGAGAYAALQARAKNQYDNNNGTGEAAAGLVMINFIDKLAKGMYNLLMPQNPTGKDINAFYIALDSTINAFRNGSKDTNYVEIKEGSNRQEKYAKKAVENADDYNCWVKYRGTWAISLSNLAEAFITNFVDGMDNYQNNCMITQKVSNSSYITDNPQYLYTVQTIEADEDQSALWEAEFYSAMFNNICENGWYENQMINDREYLENALKNGQLFVMSNSRDNYYYQTRYVQASGGHIVEEVDEAAIAEAEREYTYLKAKINYKEERIEVESKSVDAELSALNTEYETVKNLISKNIDKTFKMFQS